MGNMERYRGVIKPCTGNDIDMWLDKINFLSEATESTSQPFAAGYPDGRLLAYNNAFSELTGYSKKELANMTWTTDLTPPEWREREVRILEEMRRTGKSQRYEKEYFRKDGTRIPIELLLHQALDSCGNILFYYSFITDITLRKSALTALKKYRLMFDVVRDILYVILLDGAILDVNDAAIESYGYTREELLKMNVGELRTPEERVKLKKVLERCFRHGCTLDTVHQRKDGSTFPVEIRSRGIVIDGQKILVGMGRDITERKQAEEALRESETRYRELVENANSIILRSDRDGNITFFNEFAQRFFGYAEDEILGRNAMGTIIPVTDSAGKDLAAMLDDLLQHPEAYRTNVHQNMRKNGELVWVSWTNKAIYDDEGNLAGLLSIGNDITRLKQAEEALRENEENFQAAFEQAAVGMTHAGKDGRFMRVNQKFCDITGYTQEELVKLTAGDITYQLDIAEENLLIERLLAGELTTFSREKRYVRKDGAIVWVNLTVTPIFHKGTLEYLMGITADITERKRAEEALREAKEYAENLIETANVIVLGLDSEGTIKVFNKTAEKITGYSKAEMIGQSWEMIVPRDRYEYAWKEFDRLMDGGLPRNFENPILTKSGEERYIVWQNNEVLEQGRIVGSISFGMDITERKEAEEELGETRAQAELYLDLMGHDINNMNQVGMGYLEVALETLKEEGRIEGKDVELLEKPLHALQDSSRLIDNVRKLRSAKSREYQLLPIDLREVLQGVKEQFSKVNGRHIVINYTPTESHVLATWLVKDVFVNIIGNAVKHSDANKPLEISISQTRVYGTDESYHKVIIDDNGPGIPDELKTRIFNRFERGNTKTKGKGLGLYLVKTLVQDFDGKIWVGDRVQGDYTKGARFVVMLPAVEK